MVEQASTLSSEGPPKKAVLSSLNPKNIKKKTKVSVGIGAAIVAALFVGTYVLLATGIVSFPSSVRKYVPGVAEKRPEVELVTEYQNPFRQRSQYVNPFDDFKSPFNNLK